MYSQQAAVNAQNDENPVPDQAPEVPEVLEWNDDEENVFIGNRVVHQGSGAINPQFSLNASRVIQYVNLPNQNLTMSVYLIDFN